MMMAAFAAQGLMCFVRLGQVLPVVCTRVLSFALWRAGASEGQP